MAKDTSEAATQDRSSRPLPRRGLERLDLMLLCMEALDLNGGEAMVWMSEQLGYAGLFPNRVELWKRRCHNPLRRSCRRGEVPVAETDALIRILCVMADRLYPMLRSLLSSSEPESVAKERWDLFQGRLGELIQERMNPRRSGVQKLLDPNDGAAQRLQLVQGLSLCAGQGGFERIKASLMDAVA
ncbi:MULTISPECIES: DUF3038 domain-containing protein [unclassified Synechococcus]|uniref:DUF3038 domain-containing protein n=1 Tax=unclassified Synechococcus TaxID=2626047 RepID=UPI0016874FF9|nr:MULTISPECIES: DUF3038 domain-containing protein [unclassified Synechococcus]MBD2717830.1 DUF3038 domain-containing protein [Synechococcus sp. FACHB-909]